MRSTHSWRGGSDAISSQHSTRSSVVGAQYNRKVFHVALHSIGCTDVLEVLRKVHPFRWLSALT